MTELQGQKASESLILKSLSSQTVVWESGLVRKTRDQSVGKAANRKGGWQKGMETFQAYWDQFQYLLLRKSLQKCIPLWGSCETSFFGTVVKFLVQWKYWEEQVNQRLLEILRSLDCHREEECRVKGEVTAVSCWQLRFIMKLLLFVSWVRPSFAKQLILTKWHYSNIFLQKLKSLISFFHEEVFLKCEIHIKVVVSNVCRVLGSSLMKYSRSIGIMHHCLLGFIIQEIQGKVGMLCFFSRYMLGLSWLWLIMYFQYRAFCSPRKVV